MSEFGMRPTIRFMKKYFKNKEVIGVELGVFEGKNASRFLDMLNIKELYLVDNWITPDYAKDKYNYEQFEKDVRRKFKDHRNIVILKIDTVKTSRLFMDNFFDFVYIDADHSYNGCKADMEAWYSKVKTGGIFCGHDYYCEGVKKAVDEFVKKYNLKLFTTNAIGIYDRKKYGEWLIIK